MAKSAAIKHISPPAIRKRCCTRSRGDWNPSSAIWPRIDGKPQRAAGGHTAHAGHGDGRAGCGAGHGGTRRVTLGGDKNYDTRDFVDKLREAAVTPHVAQNQHARRSSAIDQRTTQQPGYAISQRKRKRVEEIFGWIKTIGGLRKTRHRGKDRVGWMFTFAAAAYNLVRMRNLAQAAA